MLVTSKEMLEKARREHYAVPAMNTQGGNYDIIWAICRAAEEMHSPAILAHYVATGAYSGDDWFVEVCKWCANKVSVPIAIHLDHGDSFDICMKSLKNGFTSLMIDGSTKPIEENARLTNEVIKVAKCFDVPVEAEIGELLRLDEAGAQMENKNVANPEQVRQFLNLCQPDSLAIGIGNAHGYYKGEPDIKLEVLEEVRKFTDIPFVLHGCTGMREDIIKEAIKLGVAKINFGTEIRYKYVEHYEEALKTNHQGHSWKLSQLAKNSELTYKEMYQQPASFQAVNDTLEDIFKTLDKVFFGEKKYDELIFTGCGTSLYLAQASAAAFSTYTGIPSKGVPCSELYYFPETYVKEGRNVLILPITRKSYTTEVRMAIDKVRTYPQVTTLAITCDKDSEKYNDYYILSPDTAEDSVIMTRSFTSMLYMAVIMAMYVGGKKDEIAAMKDYAPYSEKVLKEMDELSAKIMNEHKNLNLYIILGQGIYYGVANECMNKMKEMGLSNSEGYYDLEYRHGPMSLVDENTLIVCLSNKACRDGDKALMEQMKSYGAIVAVLGGELGDTFDQIADYVYSMDKEWNDMQYSAIIGFIGQLLGYYIADSKNLDADSPRHLTQAIVLK